jgi:lipoprotein NlpI
MRRLLACAVAIATAMHLGAQVPDDLKAELEKKLDYLTSVIEKNAGDTVALGERADLYEKFEKYNAAIADWTKILEIDNKHLVAYQRRGLVFFKAGKIKESISDFDRQIELNPKSKGSHWQRGISYYYAGQYENGRKQFEGYQDFDSNDVENAVWRFMCMARSDGIDKARKAILKIGDDKRVPMRQVYDLFKGDLKPADVLAAAKADRELFYAHLYVGIYHDLLGDKKKAFEHINQATEKYRIGHYMWDVARVHRDLLAAKLKKVK